VVDGASDFTGDGKSDILFHGMDDGQTTLWAMNGGQIEQRFDFGHIPNSLSILDTHGDLNGDGTHDVLWYDHSNGNVVEWLMHDGLPSIAIVANVPSSATLISAAGDYNGDGISDMVRKVGGDLVMWTMNTRGGIFSVNYVHDVNGNLMQLSTTQVVEDAVDSFDGSGRGATITDFKPNADQIELDHTAYTYAFGGPVYSPGPVPFVTGSAGPDTQPRYEFYYQSNGELWFIEPFGSVANHPVLVATLANAPHLSSHDLLIV
jgi:hypothetical protein